MKKTSKIIVALTAVLLLVALALPFSSVNMVRATSCSPDVWVAPPPTGNDANSGTQAHPFATIQQGIDVVCDDGTVHVAAGTYYENLDIDHSFTMIGSGAPTTIIDGDDSGRVLHITTIPGQTNTISGFTIQNGHIRWGCPGMPVGGGVYVAVAHIVTMNDCTIRNNNADFLGGGIYNAGQLTLNRCTVNGNSAGMVGGGIANFVDEPILDTDGTMSLVNCTIYGNNVGGHISQQASVEAIENLVSQGFAVSLALGGGVYNGGDASFLNVTIADNTVSEIPVTQRSDTSFFDVPIAYATPVIPEPHGGGFANAPLQCANDGQDGGKLIFTPVATFKNTLIADNTPENGYNAGGGTVISLGHNLDSENSCGFNQPTDLRNTDPLLGPLQDNGGPTFTCALPQNSPAVDAGDNNGAPATDQRGVSRPQGLAVDIGAYELVQTETPQESHPSVSPSTTNWTRNLDPPTMSVQFVSVNPQQATANQPVTISTNVVNTGDQGGNMNVALKINGQVEQTKMVAVGPKASQPIKFTITRAQPGTYSIDIGGQTGSFTIPDTSSKPAPVNSGMIILLVIGVLVLATVLVLIFSRKSA
jgi:hypothetical protein